MCRILLCHVFVGVLMVATTGCSTAKSPDDSQADAKRVRKTGGKQSPRSRAAKKTTARSSASAATKKEPSAKESATQAPSRPQDDRPPSSPDKNPATDQDPNEQDLAFLAGEWELSSVQAGANPVRPPSSIKMNIRGDEISIKGAGLELAHSFRIDATKLPKEMDLITLAADGGKIVKQVIYEIEGDELRICNSGEVLKHNSDGEILSQSGASRPTFIDAGEGVIEVFKAVTPRGNLQPYTPPNDPSRLTLTPKLRATFGKPDNAPGLRGGMAWHPGGKLLAAGSETNIVLWDVETQEQAHVFEQAYDSAVQFVTFSPKGDLLASLGGDNEVKIWDLAKKTLLRRFESFTSFLVFSPDGKLLVTGEGDGRVHLWDTDSLKNVGTLTGHEGYVRRAAFSPGGKILATASSRDASVKLWDVGELKLIQTLAGQKGSAVFNHDGKQLASAGAKFQVGLWNTTDRPAKQSESIRNSIDVNCVAFSPDGRLLAYGDLDENVRVRDVSMQRTLARLGPDPAKRKWRGTRAVAFSPDGKRLAVAYGDTTIRLWDLQ